jgi:hypothetical protein
LPPSSSTASVTTTGSNSDNVAVAATIVTPPAAPIDVPKAGVVVKVGSKTLTAIQPGSLKEDGGSGNYKSKDAKILAKLKAEATASLNKYTLTVTAKKTSPTSPISKSDTVSITIGNYALAAQ